MRILVLSNYYPPFELGGYEQLCRDVVVRLRERGHEVEVLTSDYGNGTAIRKTPGVQRQLRLSPRYDKRLNPAAQFVLRRQGDEVYDLRCLHEIVSRFGPDIIFIWNLQGLPRTLATQAEAISDVAVAYWLAGYSPAEPDEFWQYWSSPGRTFSGKLIKGVFSRMALSQLRSEGKPVHPEMRHTAVVSKFMRQKGLQEGTLPLNTEVIYNGVEIEGFFQAIKMEKGPLKLLQAGRVSHDKGVHVSINALNHLVNERGVQEIHLTIAGSGPPAYQSQLDALVNRSNLVKYVSFLGWVPREEMVQIMHGHHVLLLPTIHQEPFARVVLEAMVAGLAVVAADTGGTSELVQHDLSGLLCQPDDETMLAKQIQRLVEHPQLRQDLARRGQQCVVENYSLDHMVDNLEILLRRAVSDMTVA